jgi:hypothetical protein
MIQILVKDYLKRDLWHVEDVINLVSQHKMDEAEFLYFGLLLLGEEAQSYINLTCVSRKVTFESGIDWKLIS